MLNKLKKWLSTRIVHTGGLSGYVWHTTRLKLIILDAAAIAFIVLSIFVVSWIERLGR